MVPPFLSWAVAISAVGFLAICAEHNRRTGYRKTRPEHSALESVLLWLHQFRGSLAPEHGSAMAHSQPLSLVSAEQCTQDLIRLEAALRAGSVPVSVEVPATAQDAVEKVHA